jgi:hypothetical protein
MAFHFVLFYKNILKHVHVFLFIFKIHFNIYNRHVNELCLTCSNSVAIKRKLFDDSVQDRIFGVHEVPMYFVIVQITKSCDVFFYTLLCFLPWIRSAITHSCTYITNGTLQRKVTSGAILITFTPLLPLLVWTRHPPEWILDQSLYMHMNTHSPSSLAPWRWRHHVPLKRWQYCPPPHNAKIQKQDQHQQWTTVKA